MLAKDVMHTNILTGRPDTSVQDLVKMMLDYNISMIPIVDEQNKVIGVVTEGDIVYRAYSDIENVDVGVAFLGKLREMMKKLDKHKGSLAQEVMTEELYSGTEDTPLSKIAKIMVEKRVNNVPILKDDYLVGLVGRRDILRLVNDGKL